MQRWEPEFIYLIRICRRARGKRLGLITTTSARAGFARRVGDNVLRRRDREQGVTQGRM